LRDRYGPQFTAFRDLCPAGRNYYDKYAHVFVHAYVHVFVHAYVWSEGMDELIRRSEFVHAFGHWFWIIQFIGVSTNLMPGNSRESVPGLSAVIRSLFFMIF